MNVSWLYIHVMNESASCTLLFLLQLFLIALLNIHSFTHSKYHKESSCNPLFFHYWLSYLHHFNAYPHALSLTSSSSTLSSIDSQLTKLCTTPSLSQLFQETYCNYCNKRIAMKKLFRKIVVGKLHPGNLEGLGKSQNTFSCPLSGRAQKSLKWRDSLHSLMAW